VNRVELTVRYADTDAQGVVFFANYLTYMDEAMTALLAALDCDYQSWLEEGVDFVYVNAQVSYGGSARHGDVVEVRSEVSRIGRTSFTTSHTLWVGQTRVASGELTHVVIDTASRQPVPVPTRFRAAVAEVSAT